MAESATTSVELRADRRAAAQSRGWLAGLLHDWSSDAIDTVQLLVSELVTNAVLHTEDSIEVTATVTATRITVEVIDRNPTKPVVRDYGHDAATGRGLRLVDALADAWGVRNEADRKAVWFRVSDGLQSPADLVGDDDPLDMWSDFEDTPAPPPPGSPSGDYVDVCLTAIPVSTYLAVQEHHDALVREGMLMGAAEGDVNVQVPQRLRELMATVVVQFGPGNDQRRAQVERARRAGQRTVDVAMLFAAGGQAAVTTTADELDEIDDFCEQGLLLTPPSPPAVRRFRRWYTEEIVRQLDGEEAAPWPTDGVGTDPDEAPEADDWQRP
jgi:anti-sigma regulatory factor (Ser/Thr protein kinase)